MLNQTVGNYRIQSLLGEGGMGCVYSAQHPTIGRKAAIKVLHTDLAQSPDLVTRFFNEARAANAIRHPGIVEVYDFGTMADGASYIVMELLEGESLAARIKRQGRLPFAVAVDFANQTASALAAAHAARIVHRDLKPDNIFLVPDLDVEGREVVKVLDFGIAKLSAERPGGSGVKTRTGAVMGTPVYMSPEQCLGTKVTDHRADIYSLGIILYELICGQPPFLSSGYGELIHMHIGTPPAPPRAHRPSVPAALEAVILKLLAKEAVDRYQSMGEVQQALAAVRAQLISAPPRETPASSPPLPLSDPSLQTTFSSAASMIQGRAPNRRRLGVPALVVALTVAGGAAIALKVSRPPAAPAMPTPAVAPLPPPSPPAAPATIPVSIESTPSREASSRDAGVDDKPKAPAPHRRGGVVRRKKAEPTSEPLPL